MRIRIEGDNNFICNVSLMFKETSNKYDKLIWIVVMYVILFLILLFFFKFLKIKVIKVQQCVEQRRVTAPSQ